MRAATLKRWVSPVALSAGVIVALAAGGVACGADDPDETPKTVLSQNDPDPAADIDLSPPVEDGNVLSDLTFDLLEGGTGSVGDYEGKPLVINFFASWCPPCVREMPEFQSVFERLDGQVAFLGLSQDHAPEDALRLVESTGVAYDVGWDPDLEVYGATGSFAMPTTAFVSASGELRDVFAGVLDEESLAELIDAVLDVAART